MLKFKPIILLFPQNLCLLLCPVEFMLGGVVIRSKEICFTWKHKEWEREIHKQKFSSRLKTVSWLIMFLNILKIKTFIKRDFIFI